MKGRMPAGGGRMTEDTPYTCMASSLDACVRGKDSGAWPVTDLWALGPPLSFPQFPDNKRRGQA